jgi:hypothetical protein
MATSNTDLIEDLRIELAAQRLIVRSIIAHLLANSDKPMPLALRDLEEATVKMAPDVAPLADLDPVLHAKGYELARRRATALLSDLGPLVAPPRRPIRRGQAA